MPRFPADHAGGCSRSLPSHQDTRRPCRSGEATAGRAGRSPPPYQRTGMRRRNLPVDALGEGPRCHRRRRYRWPHHGLRRYYRRAPRRPRRGTVVLGRDSNPRSHGVFPHRYRSKEGLVDRCPRSRREGPAGPHRCRRSPCRSRPATAVPGRPSNRRFPGARPRRYRRKDDLVDRRRPSNRRAGTAELCHCSWPTTAAPNSRFTSRVCSSHSSTSHR